MSIISAHKHLLLSAHKHLLLIFVLPNKIRTLRSNSGAWIWEGDISSGDSLKLGNNYSQYRIYIAKKQYPNTILGDGDEFIYVGKCQSWAINCTSNCYI